MRPEAFFLPLIPASGGLRFGVFYPAQGPLRASVLYIHPLAQEMNKARRMAALQARALARQGCAVLQLDLLGCGDSAGDFAQATWSHWVGDVVQASQWLRQHSGAEAVPLWLWGLRAGCLLAVAAAAELQTPCHFLFWQPPLSGQTVLQQFLRLKLTSDWLNNPTQGLMTELRQQLANGQSVDVAGYQLSPALAHGLAQATLAPPTLQTPGQQLAWFECSAAPESALARTTLSDWQQAGFAVQRHSVPGPAFWHSSDIEESPALISASAGAVCAA